MADLPEPDAVRRWRRGDFEAFLGLARPHLAAVRALIASLAPPGGAVLDYDDLAQEVLVQAYRSVRKFDPARGDFRSWFRGIARNRIRRAWQEAARERWRARQAAFVAARAAAERDLERGFDADPVLEALDRCLAGLPERGARLIRAYYEEGCSAAEIGRRFGLTVNAVCVELHRWRRALRRCVEGRLGRA